MIGIFYICLILVIFLIYKCIIVVPVGYEWVIEILGKPKDITLKEGVHFIVPFFSKVKAKVSMKEQTMDVPPQGVITKENITIMIDSIVHYRVINPIKAVYGVEDLRKSISYTTQVAIRAVAGKLSLEEIFMSRENINLQIREELEKVADSLGCDINSVGIKDINMPKDIRELYEKKAKLQQEKMILGDEYLQDINMKADLKYKESNNEWFVKFRKYWENKDIDGIISLFDNNVNYYKNLSARLYSLEEIKEEWQEIFNEDYRRLEFNIIMQNDKGFILNIIAEEKIIHDMVIKIELNLDGKCTYFRKWEENS